MQRRAIGRTSSGGSGHRGVRVGSRGCCNRTGSGRCYSRAEADPQDASEDADSDSTEVDRYDGYCRQCWRGDADPQDASEEAESDSEEDEELHTDEVL